MVTAGSASGFDSAIRSLEFPVCVEYRRSASPDFIISTAKRRIGVEVTSCTPEQLRRARSLQEEHYLPLIDAGAIEAGGSFKKNRDLLHAIRKIGPEDQEFEVAVTHTAESVEAAIRRKRSKLQQQTFAKFSENWLLVYDDYDIADQFMIALLPVEIHRRLSRPNNLQIEFDRIYIYIDALELRWKKNKLLQRVRKQR